MSIRLKDTIYDNVDKLSSSAGNATQPIYFSNGKPTSCTYTLGKSVPSDAKFTDTTYSAGTGLSLSGTTFNHAASVTAGTAGTSSATSGSTISIPYVTVNATGHVTGYGTHSHTVTGFAASSHSHSYLPLSGGTLTGNLNIQHTSSASLLTFYPYAYEDTFAGIHAHMSTGDPELITHGLVFGTSKLTSYGGKSSLNLFNNRGSNYYTGSAHYFNNAVYISSNLAIHAGNWSSYCAASDHTHSGYAAASHSHSYLPLSGGTLSGDVAFSTGGSPTIHLYPGSSTSYCEIAGHMSTSSSGTINMGIRFNTSSASGYAGANTLNIYNARGSNYYSASSHSFNGGITTNGAMACASLTVGGEAITFVT